MQQNMEQIELNIEVPDYNGITQQYTKFAPNYNLNNVMQLLNKQQASLQQNQNEVAMLSSLKTFLVQFPIFIKKIKQYIQQSQQIQYVYTQLLNGEQLSQIDLENKFEDSRMLTIETRSQMDSDVKSQQSLQSQKSQQSQETQTQPVLINVQQQVLQEIQTQQQSEQHNDMIDEFQLKFQQYDDTINDLKNQIIELQSQSLTDQILQGPLQVRADKDGNVLQFYKQNGEQQILNLNYDVTASTLDFVTSLSSIAKDKKILQMELLPNTTNKLATRQQQIKFTNDSNEKNTEQYMIHADDGILMESQSKISPQIQYLISKFA